MTGLSGCDFITGVSAAAGGAALARLLRAGTPLTVVVGNNLGRAEILAEDAVFFAGLRQNGNAEATEPEIFRPKLCGLPKIERT